MASATKKTTVSGSFCVDNALPSSSSSSISRAAASAASAPVSASAGNAPQDWTVASTDHRDDQLGKEVAMASMICAVDSLPEPSANASSKGIPTMLRAQTSHPSRNYTAGETRGGVDRSDVKPLQIVQPEGLSFRVNGYFVEWQKWNFRIGFTPREGLVMYSVAYVDGSRGRRPVAHRLSFVEMVVPYGDPNDPHYQKNAFDAGEDGLGKNALS